MAVILEARFNEALILIHEGKLDQAEAHSTDILNFSKFALGEKHSETLLRMRTQAVIWKHRGRDDDAIALLKDCLQWQSERLGWNHPHTRTSRRTLAEWNKREAVSLILRHGVHSGAIRIMHLCRHLLLFLVRRGRPFFLFPFLFLCFSLFLFLFLGTSSWS